VFLASAIKAHVFIFEDIAGFLFLLRLHLSLSMNPEGPDRLGQRVRKGVSRLRGTDVGDDLQVEILSQLVEGRKTMAELVERIYGLQRDDQGFSSSYTKVRRATKRLESKGLLATKLFGKEKPYRLTDLAIINLARIGGEKEQIALVSRSDLALYIATAALAVPIASLGSSWLQVSDPGVAAFFACFFYLLGASTSRIAQTLRKVW
jgi:hypothetical protein